MRLAKKPEILSPAGDMEKLKVAIAYGADAVYLGGRRFSLRAGAGNFDGEDMSEAIRYAHDHGVKVYVAVNIFAFNRDLMGMREYFAALADMGADAFIVSDPGVLSLALEAAPHVDIHISTQANVTNYESVRFWQRQGVKRIILSRELSLEHIREIREHVPDIELEAFVHGAMCVAYSGRCLLSHYLTSRSANQGECAHPCRYNYHVMEEKRPGQYLPVEEDERGVTLFASNDLCMAEHLPLMRDAGIDGLKIEGRMKSAFYVGLTTQAYRRAIDDLWNDAALYENNKPGYMRQLTACAHRGNPDYTTGFYLGQPGQDAQDYSGIPYARTQEFAGLVMDYDAATGMALIEQRGKFSVGDTVVVTPSGSRPAFNQTVHDLFDENGQHIDSARHPKQIVRMVMDRPVQTLDLLGKPCEP